MSDRVVNVGIHQPDYIPWLGLFYKMYLSDVFIHLDDALLDYMLSHKHFQGRWWRYLIEERPSNTFEYRMSRYLLPITIDQRYNSTDIEYIYHLITNKNE